VWVPPSGARGLGLVRHVKLRIPQVNATGFFTPRKTCRTALHAELPNGRHERWKSHFADICASARLSTCPPCLHATWGACLEFMMEPLPPFYVPGRPAARCEDARPSDFQHLPPSSLPVHPARQVRPIAHPHGPPAEPSLVMPVQWPGYQHNCSARPVASRPPLGMQRFPSPARSYGAVIVGFGLNYTPVRGRRGERRCTDARL
jgi:hypothetical protein